MKPISHFLNKPKSFWALIRSLSQKIGYSANGDILVPNKSDLLVAFMELNIYQYQIILNNSCTELMSEVIYYFSERASMLHKYAEKNLQNVEQARAMFLQLQEQLKPSCPIPMNKQRGQMRTEAFLTGIVNMLIEQHTQGVSCDFDPRKLVTITRDGMPVRTFARRLDGAFPSTVNPIAVWEIKEYYYTTTFGSRIADGVYETLLDGMEIKDLREHEGIDIKHYLMVDSYYPWWGCGKSYLCRMFDMLHMGYVDEILFGKEVVAEMPRIVSEWVAIHQTRNRSCLG